MKPKPPTTKPRTLEDVILWPNEDEKLAQVKCTECGCICSFFKDLPGFKRFIDKGFGIRKTYRCIKPNCTCHHGNGKLPRILMRDVTLDEAFGVKDG